MASWTFSMDPETGEVDELLERTYTLPHQPEGSTMRCDVVVDRPR